MNIFKILILITLLTACANNPQLVTIKGNIENKDNNSLKFSSVAINSFSPWFKETAVIDSLGNFEISLPVKKTQFVNLSYGRKNTQLIVSPGKTYELSLKNSFELQNESELQGFYNSLPQTHPLSIQFLGNDCSNYDSICTNLKIRLKNELNKLDELTCTREAYNLVKADREVYYNLAISSIASRNNISYIRKDSVVPKAIMDLWKTSSIDYIIGQEKLQFTTYFYDLLGLTMWYEVYNLPDYNEFREIRSNNINNGLKHTHTISLSQKFLPTELQEFYTATYIMIMAKQSKYENELIQLFSAFEAEYPESKYSKYIKPEIDNIVEFNKKVSAEVNADYIFLEKYEQINSLKECLSKLKGKRFYIDMWTTSCRPCKEQFKYSAKLKKILDKENVEILYLSLDSDRNLKLWEDMIKYYDLKGYHARANKALKLSIKEKLGSFGIPRYLLIDESGNIVNDNAARPSQLSKLEDQIKNN